MINPREMSWADPTAREDGTAFGAPDFKAYELGSAAASTGPFTALLALPVQFGVGKSPIPDAVREITGRTQWLALRVVDRNNLASDWSAPVEVRFVARPRAPAAFSVA